MPGGDRTLGEANGHVGILAALEVDGNTALALQLLIEAFNLILTADALGGGAPWPARSRRPRNVAKPVVVRGQTSCLSPAPLDMGKGYGTERIWDMQASAGWCRLRLATSVDSVPNGSGNEFNIAERCLFAGILGFRAATRVAGRFLEKQEGRDA